MSAKSLRYIPSLNGLRGLPPISVLATQAKPGNEYDIGKPDDEDQKAAHRKRIYRLTGFAFGGWLVTPSLVQ
jgi:hypothetical protein